jgi:DNA helicase-2/ATP-dependent DNA helicase PcrA
VEKLMAEAVNRGCTVWQVMVSQAWPPLPAEAQQAVRRFTELIAGFRSDTRTKSLLAVADDLIRRIEYRTFLNRQYAEPAEQEQRWASVAEVMNVIGQYERETTSPQWEEMLDQISLGDRHFDDEKDKQLARNAVALMTYHSAKGLEFPQVFMVGMEEGILPHARSIATGGDAIDEERRLCYVGITRAQERLSLSLCLSRMKWGKARETIPSRFLWEVAGQAESAKAQAAIQKAREEFGPSAANRRGVKAKRRPSR